MKTTHKQFILLCCFCTIILSKIFSQTCANPNLACDNFNKQYPTRTISSQPTDWEIVDEFLNGGNWMLFSVKEGITYEWSTCSAFPGGKQGWNATLSLYNNSNNNKLCYSNNSNLASCPNAPYIKWTASFTGLVKLLISASTTSPCQNNGPKAPYSTLVWRQSGQPSCSNWSISPASKSFAAEGGFSSFSVSSSSICTFTAVNNNPEIITNVTASSGQVNYQVKENVSETKRNGSISIRDANGNIVKSFLVEQEGKKTLPQLGAVEVIITPQGAINAGASWSLDGSGEYNSGFKLTQVPTGSHTVSFKSIEGWIKPTDQSIVVTTEKTSSITGAYIENAKPQFGQVTVNIVPQAAIDAGAKWSLDGKGEYSSGHTLSEVAIGDHQVGFKNIDNWIKPIDKQIKINSNSTTTVSETYTKNSESQVGSIKVTITPQSAIDAGAKWSLDGKGEYNSGHILTQVQAGEHVVSFKNISNWIKPVDQLAVVSNSKASDLTASYTKNINSNGYTLSGNVYDVKLDLVTGSLRESPVTNPSVILFKAGSNTPLQVSSIDNFIFKDIQPGNYTIQAEKDGLIVKITNLIIENKDNSVNIRIPIGLVNQVIKKSKEIEVIKLQHNGDSQNLVGFNIKTINSLLNEWKNITLQNENDLTYYDALSRLYIVVHALDRYAGQHEFMSDALTENIREIIEYFLTLSNLQIVIKKIVTRCDSKLCNSLKNQLVSLDLQASLYYGILLQRLIKDDSKLKPIVPYLESLFRFMYEKIKSDSEENIEEIFYKYALEKNVRSIVKPAYFKYTFVNQIEKLLEATVEQQRDRVKQYNSVPFLWSTTSTQLAQIEKETVDKYSRASELIGRAEYAQDQKDFGDILKSVGVSSDINWITKAVPYINTIIRVSSLGIDIFSGYSAAQSTVVIFNHSNKITNTAKTNLDIIAKPKNREPFNEFNNENFLILQDDLSKNVSDFNKKLLEITTNMNTKRFSLATNKLNQLISLDSMVLLSSREILRTIDASYNLLDIHNKDSLYYNYLYNIIYNAPSLRLKSVFQIISSVIDTTSKASIDSLNRVVAQTIKNNNSMLFEVQDLNELLSGFQSMPYIAVKRTTLQQSIVASSSNEIEVIYKNYGNTNAKNVHMIFEINSIAGLIADTIDLGEVASNEEGIARIIFQAPAIDTILSYSINFKGTNIVSEGYGGIVKVVKPSVNFSYEIDQTCTPTIVSFKDNSTCGSESLVKARYWRFYGQGVYPNESKEKDPKVKYSQNGLFSVKLYITCDGNVKDSLLQENLLNIGCTTTGLSDSPDSEQVLLHPNPNNGIFNIDFKLNEPQMVKITVYNILGQAIFTQSLNRRNGIFQEKIAMNTTHKGTYIVAIQVGERILFEKINIQ